MHIFLRHLACFMPAFIPRSDRCRCAVSIVLSYPPMIVFSHVQPAIVNCIAHPHQHIHVYAVSLLFVNLPDFSAQDTWSTISKTAQCVFGSIFGHSRHCGTPRKCPAASRCTTSLRIRGFPGLEKSRSSAKARPAM